MPPYFMKVTLACHYTQNVPGQSGRCSLLKPGSKYSLTALEEVLVPKVIKKIEKPGNRKFFLSTNIQCVEPVA